MNNPWLGTRDEFDQLPADGKYNCPDCGLKLTQPRPGCFCPNAVAKSGLFFTYHINKYHHNCDDAWNRAYGGER